MDAATRALLKQTRSGGAYPAELLAKQNQPPAPTQPDPSQVSATQALLNPPQPEPFPERPAVGVNGVGPTDTIPVWMAPNEFVLNAMAMKYRPNVETFIELANDAIKPDGSGKAPVVNQQKLAFLDSLLSRLPELSHGDFNKDLAVPYAGLPSGGMPPTDPMAPDPIATTEPQSFMNGGKIGVGMAQGGDVNQQVTPQMIQALLAMNAQQQSQPQQPAMPQSQGMPQQMMAPQQPQMPQQDVGMVDPSQGAMPEDMGMGAPQMPQLDPMQVVFEIRSKILEQLKDFSDVEVPLNGTQQEKIEFAAKVQQAKGKLGEFISGVFGEAKQMGIGEEAGVDEASMQKALEAVDAISKQKLGMLSPTGPDSNQPPKTPTIERGVTDLTMANRQDNGDTRQMSSPIGETMKPRFTGAVPAATSPAATSPALGKIAANMADRAKEQPVYRNGELLSAQSAMVQ
jgi:hypothetical protein